jgi:quinoprotein glucose dehydrogenase
LVGQGEGDVTVAGFRAHLPATFAIDGKQFVVIACGGGKMGTKSGDSYVAFALPDQTPPAPSSK